jgi:hypothetical protein
VSGKNAVQICRANLPGKAAGQGCRARLPGKAAGQGCRARLPGKAAGQGCRARLPGKSSQIFIYYSPFHVLEISEHFQHVPNHTPSDLF